MASAAAAFASRAPAALKAVPPPAANPASAFVNAETGLLNVVDQACHAGPPPPIETVASFATPDPDARPAAGLTPALGWSAAPDPAALPAAAPTPAAGGLAAPTPLARPASTSLEKATVALLAVPVPAANPAAGETPTEGWLAVPVPAAFPAGASVATCTCRRVIHAEPDSEVESVAVMTAAADEVPEDASR